MTHWGQNSAPHHVDFMQSGAVCPFAAQHPATCRIWWVTTHQRLNHIDHGPDKPTARTPAHRPLHLIAAKLSRCNVSQVVSIVVSLQRTCMAGTSLLRTYAPACAFHKLSRHACKANLERPASEGPKGMRTIAQDSHIAITNFNVGMRAYFEAGHCGPAHVVDVYNMTDALVFNRTFEETRAMTHDGFHWSMVRGPAEMLA